MNYKIAKTMLILCIVFLSVFYILKFIFPDLLIQVITNPTLLRLGEFINSWIGYSIIVNVICVFITFYLFACASCGRFKFSAKEIGICSAIVVANILVYYFLPELYTHISTASLFIVSCICKGNLTYATISFSIHGILSQFLLSIRGFETIIVQITKMGTLSALILGFEMHLWLILLAIIFYFKENKRNGIDLSTLS